MKEADLFVKRRKDHVFNDSNWPLRLSILLGLLLLMASPFEGLFNASVES